MELVDELFRQGRARPRDVESGSVVPSSFAAVVNLALLGPRDDLVVDVGEVSDVAHGVP